MADNQIKFYRGVRPEDLSQLNPNAIYFFTDSKEIYTGGKTYGMSGEQTAAFNERIAALQGEVDTLELDVEKILQVLGVIEGYENDTVLERLDVAEENLAGHNQVIAAHEEAIDNLVEYVGTIPSTATATNVVAYVNEKVADALKQAGSETAASVAQALETHAAENAEDFEAVNAELSAVKNTADAAKNAIDAFKAAADVSEKAIDTLLEIQEYIDSDKEAAAEMLLKIGAAQDAADAAQEAADAAQSDADDAQAAADAAAELAAQGVADAATAQAAADAAQEAADAADDKADAAQAAADAAAQAIEALEDVVETKAAQTALDEAVGRIAANEAAIAAIDNHSHENKEVLDGIDASKVAAWDVAEQNAKDYADSLLVWNAIA